MSSIAGVSSTSVVGARSAPRQETPPSRAAQALSSRALIALQPPAAMAETPLRTHPDARFVAHLIATDQKVPQTRERRRADPQVAVSAYTAANAGPAAPTGQRIFRVM
jgi:hypothetical protein